MHQRLIDIFIVYIGNYEFINPFDVLINMHIIRFLSQLEFR